MNLDIEMMLLQDIRLWDENNHGIETQKTHCKVLKIQSHISYRIRYSLRVGFLIS